jgi:hypothetical protein
VFALNIRDQVFSFVISPFTFTRVCVTTFQSEKLSFYPMHIFSSNGYLVHYFGDFHTLGILSIIFYKQSSAFLL